MGRRLGGLLAIAITVTALACVLGTATASAASGYYVTIAARDCPSYSDIYANKARNDIVESLEDLGPNTQYGNSGALVSPAYEDMAPQTNCRPLPNWRFTLGTGYQTRVVTGAWGSLSKVTGPYNTSVLTQDSTPLLDNRGDKVGSQTIPGAVTVKLTDQQAAQASKSSSLWLQGGTPTDPVLASVFGTPQAPDYGFGTLRCATDNVNGDNVEYVFFPSGTNHVFCYAYYVSPPPTSGTIRIHKQVVGAPAGANPAFPFNGDMSFDPNGFALRNGESTSFYRAGGEAWSITEGNVTDYKLDSVNCTSTAPGGGPGTSTTGTSGGTLSVALSAGDTVDCTFLNSWVPPTGSLTIAKITDGGVGGPFHFSVEPADGGQGTLVSATTKEDGVPVNAGPGDSLVSLAPGSYKISENRPVNPSGGWTLTKVECDGTSRNTRDVTITVERGVDKACTFTNTLEPHGAIHISKVTEGGIGRSAFVIESLSSEPVQYHQDALTGRIAVPADATPNTDADATDHLYLGRYRIIEQPPLNGGTHEWELTSVNCDGVEMPFTDGSVEITLTRSAREANCRFTNTLVRHASPDPEPTEPGEPTPPTTEPPAKEPGDPEIPGRGGTPARPTSPGSIPPGPTGPAGSFPGPSNGPTRPEGTTPVPGNVWANLAVASTPEHKAVRSGQRIIDRIVVTNRGPSDAEDVMLGSQAPEAHRLVSVTGEHVHCSRDLPMICRLGTIKPHHKVALTVVLAWAPRSGASSKHAVGSGVFRMHETVGASTYDPRMSDNSASERVRIERARRQPPRRREPPVPKPPKHRVACPAGATPPVARPAC